MCGVWSVECKVRNVECGDVWSVKCGKMVWSLKCGVESVECGV